MPGSREGSFNGAVFFVVGSTGTGKSSAAVSLAGTLKNEYRVDNVVIVNCDVMQFYVDLPIATNKARKEEMAGIPHVFMGFLNPDDSCACSPQHPYLGEGHLLRRTEPYCKPWEGPFNVQAYSKEVTRFMEDFFEEHPDGAVIVCGGTCYYAQSILLAETLVTDGDNCDTSPSLDCCVPKEELWKKVNEIDPAVASRYHPNDERRLRRLLQIHGRTGSLPSDVFAEKKPSLRFPQARCFILWLQIERERLNSLLDARVDEMVARGLAGEVQALHSLIGGKSISSSLTEAIGFKEFPSSCVRQETADAQEEFSRGVEVVKSNTRRYARQQVQWITNRFIPALTAATDEVDFVSHFARVSVLNKEQLKEDVKKVARCWSSLSERPVSDTIDYPLSSKIAHLEPVTQERCTVCDTIVYGRDQMPIHLKSKRHAGALRRKRAEAEYFARFGHPLPPRKRGKTEL